MKPIVKVLLLLFGLQASITLGMDAPHGWVHSLDTATHAIDTSASHTSDPAPTHHNHAPTVHPTPLANMPVQTYSTVPFFMNTDSRPNRPSQAGSGRPSRPRPQAVNYGTAPIAAPTAAPTYGPTPMNPMHIVNTQGPVAQPQVTNPMHIINTGTTATIQTPATNATTGTLMAGLSKKERERLEKERERLEKIEKDLDKIEEVLKEMGFDLAVTALSAASLDPIGAAFAASNSVITIPKLAYYYGNMQKHIFFLSSSQTSPEAKARLKQLTPRLQTVSRIISKGPESLQKMIKKFSKDEPKEAK